MQLVEEASAVGRNASGVGTPRAPDAVTPTKQVGTLDVDDFDELNATLGRAAGDQVMVALRRLIATITSCERFLSAYQLLGPELKWSRPLATTLPAGVLVCHPYDSGDEFIVLNRDPARLAEMLQRIVREADELEIAVLDQAGRVCAVVHGLPVSTGAGATPDEAWRAMLAVKRAGGRRGIASRIELRGEAAGPADGQDTPPEDVAGSFFRDGPQRDPTSGLPTTLDLVSVEAFDGEVPALMWGPVEVRRPGWTHEQQQQMLLAIGRYMVSLGITDRAQILATAREVATLTDQVWRAMESAARARS